MYNLRKKQQQILDGFKKHGDHTNVEMSELLGISTTDVKIKTIQNDG